MNTVELIDTIFNIASAVDKTGRFHKNQIKMLCDIVYTQRMTMFPEEVMRNIDSFSKEYTGQSPTLDATRNLRKLTIPAEVIPLPKIPSGIRIINTAQGLDLDFVGITEREYMYMGGTDTQTLDTTIAYWINGSTIWFNESMTPAIANAGVRVVLIPRFAEYARTDNISIPGGTDYDFIQQVLTLLGVTAPVDLKANNA